MAKQYCRNVTSPRDGKTVYIGSDWKTVTSKQFNTEYTLRAGYEITERTIDKYGQFNLVPDIEVEAWPYKDGGRPLNVNLYILVRNLPAAIWEKHEISEAAERRRYQR